MVSIVAPINQLGYGVAALNILKSLSEITDVSLWPIGNPQLTNKKDIDVYNRAVENAKFFDVDAPCIRIWHQNDMSQFVGNGERIGFPIFELNKFNKLEKHHLSSVDRLFVCSEWAKEIIKNEIWPIREVPVDVIPLGVDSSVFNNTVNDVASKSTIFFNCGKWEVRKGHDILGEAFKRAFKVDDNAHLVMMCENPFNNNDEEGNWERKYQDPRFTLLKRVPTHKEVYNIMKQTHCGVFPSRAEGWNLEALEMLACGKQLIVTDYSAHREFCNKDNSKLISIDNNTIAYDGKWFHGHGEWAEIGDNQINQLISHMKEVHRMVQSGDNINNDQGIATARQFSWFNTAKKIMKVLNYDKEDT